MKNEMVPLAVGADEIYWHREVAIKPGRLADFLEVARALMVLIEVEPGTLSYRFSLGADKSVCHIHEHFTNSDAVVAHVKALDSEIEKRLSSSCQSIRFSVYGSPSEIAREALAPFGPTYFTEIRPPRMPWD